MTHNPFSETGCIISTLFVTLGHIKCWRFLSRDVADFNTPQSFSSVLIGLTGVGQAPVWPPKAVVRSRQWSALTNGCIADLLRNSSSRHKQAAKGRQLLSSFTSTLQFLRTIVNAANFSRWTITALAAGVVIYLGAKYLIDHHQEEKRQDRLETLQSMLLLEHQQRHPPELTHPKVRSALQPPAPTDKATGKEQDGHEQ